MAFEPPKGWELPQFLIELADDWHPRGYRISVGWEDVILPKEIGTVVFDLSEHGAREPRVTGRYLRTGTAEDGVPVYAWIPEDVAQRK